MKILRPALATLLALALASPALAYVIYFKDGSRIIASEKYRVEGSKAYIVLQNGTTTVYDASQIDVERTGRANSSNLGTALLVEGGELREVPIEDVPKRDQPTLRELIAAGAAGPRRVPDRRPEPVPEDRDRPRPAGPQRTPAGFVDLSSLERRGFPDSALAAELRREFERRELDEIAVYQGTTARRPLVEVTTGSEAAVFRALLAGARTLLQVRESRPREIEALELLLITPSGQRAGQFVLTPEAATELISSRLDIDTMAAFFLRHVQF